MVEKVEETVEPLILVTLPRREPPPLPDRPTGDLARLVELWSRCVEEVPKGGSYGDFEDWVEPAYRILAAVEAVGADRVWVRTTPGIVVSAWDGRKMLSKDLSDSHQDVGLVQGRHMLDRDLTGALASNYMDHKTFISNAGRKCVLADILTGDEHDSKNVIKNMRADGVGKLFVKGRLSKSLTISVEEDETLEDALGEGGEWTLIRQEGDRDALLIQEYVKMRFEYRIFVVDNQLVTGASSVEEHTPLDNRETFSALLREDRANKSPVQYLSEVRDQLVSFAQKMVTDFKLEVPELTNYVLDVALDSAGEPLIVELNSLPNSGYFAVNPRLIMRALLK